MTSGFFSRTISKFRPSGGTAGTRQSSFGRKRNPAREGKGKADDKKAEVGGASGQRTVFISCSALIKEARPQPVQSTLPLATPLRWRGRR